MTSALQVVFLDSNMFIEAQLTRNRGLLELSEVAAESNTPLITADIVRAELILWSKREARNKFARVREAIKNLDRYTPVADRILPQLSEEFDPEQFVAQYLEGLNIEVLQFPKDMDLSDLVVKSVSHVPPFSEEDKGFRDYLIFETCLRAYPKYGCTEALFVSKDGVFSANEAELRNRVSEDGLEIRFFNSIEAVTAYLKDRIEDSVLIAKKTERDTLFSRIIQYENVIFDFVRNSAQLSVDGVMGSPFGGTLFSKKDVPSGSILKKVQSVTPQVVDRDFFDFFGGYPDENDRNTVTVWVKTVLDIIVEAPRESMPPFGPVQSVNAGEADFSNLSRFSLPHQYEQRSYKVMRDVSVKLRIPDEPNEPIHVLSASLP